MVQEQNAVMARFVQDGYFVLPHAISQGILRSMMVPAMADAKEVPIDPRGGLPWAYDVYPSDYEPLTRHAGQTMVALGAKTSQIHRVTLIKKLPGEGRRYWHNDADGVPMRLGDVLVLYYLTGSMNDNGPLLVRPGYVSGPKHEALDDWPRPDEVAVPAEIGDVILMDPRLQHSSLPNNSSAERLLIRIWTVNQWE